MTESYMRKCENNCDFVIAVEGHDFDIIKPVVEAYDECPNCGGDLVKMFENHVNPDSLRIPFE